MAVNGVPIQIGQVWRSKDGQSMVAIVGSSTCDGYRWKGDDDCDYTSEGGFWTDNHPDDDDLVELIAGPGFVQPKLLATNGAMTDDNGWFAHILGSEQPEITKGQRVQVRSPNGRVTNTGHADGFDWGSVSEYRLTYGEAQAEQPVDPLSTQVSGDHYKKLAIQPVQYIHANKIGYFEGSVIKYVTRWRDKGGIADLEKAKHFIELLIQLEKKGGSQ